MRDEGEKGRKNVCVSGSHRRLGDLRKGEDPSGRNTIRLGLFLEGQNELRTSRTEFVLTCDKK